MNQEIQNQKSESESESESTTTTITITESENTNQIKMSTSSSNNNNNNNNNKSENHQIQEITNQNNQNNNQNNSSSLSPVYLSSPSPSTSQSQSQSQSQPSTLSTSTSSPSSSPKPAPAIPLPNQKQPSKPTSNLSLNTSFRLRKGIRLEDAYPTPSSIQAGEGLDPSSFLHSIESPFQVQEYIALLVRADPHNVDQIVNLPSPNLQSTPGTPNPTTTTTNPLVPQEVWIYEQLRRFSQDLSHPFVSTLQTECSRTTCPEMKAGEWLYLCAAHATANENDCCAIDYIVHTLDGATALLNSARYFPSRLQIPTTSIKHFTSIARRLYRIFAHAWFHHRDVFDQCETETSLYARFLALTDRFSLISEDLLVIPRTNEEEEQEEEEDNEESSGLSEKQERNEDDDELEELE